MKKAPHFINVGGFYETFCLDVELSTADALKECPPFFVGEDKGGFPVVFRVPDTDLALFPCNLHTILQASPVAAIAGLREIFVFEKYPPCLFHNNHSPFLSLIGDNRPIVFFIIIY